MDGRPQPAALSRRSFFASLGLAAVLPSAPRAVPPVVIQASPLVAETQFMLKTYSRVFTVTREALLADEENQRRWREALKAAGA